MQQAYFLGGSTANGFQTRFSCQMERPEQYTFVLKGGPGTGKSTLMRRVAAEFSDEEPVSVYHCASDASSLDAVVLEARGIAVVDGTAPHVFEVAQPMISGEIVNLGACLDGALLRRYGEAIRETAAENARHHRRARQYIQAISALHDDLAMLGAAALMREKLSGFGERLARRILPKGSDGGAGELLCCQLSALTADGYLTQPLPDDWQIFVLRDTFFSGADVLLRQLAEEACARGFACRVSLNYLTGGALYEHLLLPELKLALLSENGCATPAAPPAQAINFTRFYGREELSRRRQRIGFDQKASRSLRDEAATAIAEALAVHDRLEQFYIAALDIPAAERITAEVIAKIRAGAV